MIIATVTPLSSRNELAHWDNRPFCGSWPDPQHKKPTGVTKTLKKKTKRNRTSYSTEQLRALEKSFTQSRYIDSETRKRLAKSLKLGDKCIKIWFQNRRMKEKRDSSESSSNASSESLNTEISSGINSNQENEYVLNNEHVKNSILNINEEKEHPINNEQLAQEYYNYQINYNTEHTNYPMYYYNNMYHTEYYPTSEQDQHTTGNYVNNEWANYSTNGWCSNNYYYGYN